MYKVIGLENVDYKSKKTGKQVTGKRVHLTFTSDKVDGFACLNEFVNAELCEGLQVGDVVNIYYNKYGTISHIVCVN